MKSKIKDRICKLLALSKSPHEAEAASAMAKAHELLSKYGLGKPDLSSDVSGIIELAVAVEAHIKPWEEKLLGSILSATFTEALCVDENSKQKLIVIGREANVVTAKILYEYLHETVERKAKMFCESIEDLESFRMGMINSIDKKFQDQQNGIHDSDKKRDLVVVLENERSGENLQYIREHYGNPDFSENWHGVDPNSYRLGKSIGRKISISRQLFSKTE